MSPLIILGAALFVGALALQAFSKRAAHRAFLLSTTKTRNLAEVEALVEAVRSELPGDEASGYAEHCELKGVLTSESPVSGELSGEEVALSECKVERHIETRHESRDSHGKVNVSWRKSVEVLNSHRRESVFFLNSHGRKIRILPAGAELTLHTVVDRFEPPASVEQQHGSGLSLTIGTFSLSLAGGLQGSSRRTLGYRFEERALPLDRPIYAMGEVADTNDGLVLRKPHSSDSPFILSVKSEGELVAESQSSAKWRRVGAVSCAVLGIALVVIGLLK